MQKFFIHYSLNTVLILLSIILLLFLRIFIFKTERGIIMLNLFKLVAVFIVALNLFGCSSVSVKEVGSFKALKNIEPNKGTIYVYREERWKGAINQYDVLANGAVAGSLPNGSFFTVSAKPGQTQINATSGAVAKFSVKKNKVYCAKLTVNFCFSCLSADITPVDIAQCKKEIAPLVEVRMDKTNQ